MKYLLSVIGAVALAAPGFAANPGTEPDKAQEEATEEAKDRVICKREKATGSRMRAQQVCMTQAQWAQAERDDRRTLEQSRPDQ